MLEPHNPQNLDAPCAQYACDKVGFDLNAPVCFEDNQQALYDLLHSFKVNSATYKDQGSSFEHLFVDFLKYDKKYQDLYIKVQLFNEWAAEHPKLAHTMRDTGIDVVATNRMDTLTCPACNKVWPREVETCSDLDSSFCSSTTASSCGLSNIDACGTQPSHLQQTFTAFQCKFYSCDTEITKADIDSFCNASDKIFFTDRYIVTTNFAFSDNALHSFADKAVPVKFITLTDLANSSINWRAYQHFAASKIISIKRKLRPYQQEAVHKVLEGFESSSRGRLIMACGTGKTFVALNIAESLPEIHPFVLVLVPSISLLSQFLTEWKHYASVPLTAFAVCSDSSVGQGDDKHELSSLSELAYPATTNPQVLAQSLLRHFKSLNLESDLSETLLHPSLKNGSGSSVDYTSGSYLEFSGSVLTGANFNQDPSTWFDDSTQDPVPSCCSETKEFVQPKMTPPLGLTSETLSTPPSLLCLIESNPLLASLDFVGLEVDFPFSAYKKTYTGVGVSFNLACYSNLELVPIQCSASSNGLKFSFVYNTSLAQDLAPSLLDWSSPVQTCFALNLNEQKVQITDFEAICGSGSGASCSLASLPFSESWISGSGSCTFYDIGSVQEATSAQDPVLYCDCTLVDTSKSKYTNLDLLQSAYTVSSATFNYGLTSSFASNFDSTVASSLAYSSATATTSSSSGFLVVNNAIGDGACLTLSLAPSLLVATINSYQDLVRPSLFCKDSDSLCASTIASLNSLPLTRTITGTGSDLDLALGSLADIGDTPNYASMPFSDCIAEQALDPVPSSLSYLQNTIFKIKINPKQSPSYGFDLKSLFWPRQSFFSLDPSSDKNSMRNVSTSLDLGHSLFASNLREQDAVFSALPADLSSDYVADCSLYSSSGRYAISASTYSATTAPPQRHVTVVISTYQSINVIAAAQHHFHIPEFDLIICDEAHRTTGCFDLSECRDKQRLSLAPNFAVNESANISDPDFSQDNYLEDGTIKFTKIDYSTPRFTDSLDTINFTEGTKVPFQSDFLSKIEYCTQIENINPSKTSVRDDCTFSSFTAVHQDSFVLGKRRLFMTATPKVFVDDQRSNKYKYEVYSMDNPKLYGPCFYSLGFDQAVELGCLVDYKVLVLGIDHRLLPLFDELSEIDKANCAKVIGTFKALSKFGVINIDDDPDPIHRAVCFAQVIDSNDPKKVASKKLVKYFNKIISDYTKLVELQALNNDVDSEIAQEYAFFKKHSANFVCKHIDGNMSALQKNSLLEWMREQMPPDESRLLFNVRCLSEGVDLPALDAIVFLSSRRSIVEVLQALGRVMRKAPNKNFGYVILPVILRDQEAPDETFDRYPEFRVVWQVLNALKSFYPDKEMVDSRLNKLDSHIQIACLRSPLTPRKVYALSSADSLDDVSLSRHCSPFLEKEEVQESNSQLYAQDVLTIAENIKAMILRHQGNRRTWVVWANVVAQIFQEQVQLLSAQITQHAKLQQLFTSFQHDMSNTLRIPLTSQAVIEMLSQHIVVRPILVELFKGFPFTEHNPIAKAMDQMVLALEQEGLIKANHELQSFYDSVASRMQDVKTLEDRQIVILDLFDSFFKQAFPKLQEKLGIVYTPVEVVDFINNSVNDLLKREFGQSLAAPKVHILDPFTGTGTFIARMMLDPALLPDVALERKYKQELHAFEVMPIAYYIASINMEAVYAERMQQTPEQYEPNRIMVLTDTFADMHDLHGDQVLDKSLQDADLEINHQRREQVEAQPLWVILGNPPYSVGQNSQNDNNPNLNYHTLDARISETYVAQVSSQSNKASLYDTYIKAFRWASDHLGSQGIIAFVSNAGWIDSAVASGMRRCLQSEFSSVYIFHLKGNKRTAGEQCLKEGGKIFGDGCRAPVAITILVKNPQAKKQGMIYFASVDDYLSREAKLAVLCELKSIVNVSFTELTQDKHGDWLEHRRDDFARFLPISNKHSASEDTVFSLFSRGITTGRDAWSFNASSQVLTANFKLCISFYNAQVEKFLRLGPDFIKDNDATKIKWDDSLISRLQQKKLCSNFNESLIVTALYRPFVKEKLYFDLTWVTRRYQILKLFPCPESNNLVISVQGQRANSVFSCLMTNCISSSGLIDNDQLFPRYVYTPVDEFLAREGGLALSKSQLLTVNGFSVFTTNDIVDASRSGSVNTLSTIPFYANKTSSCSASYLLEGKVVINGFVREDAITPQAIAYFRQTYAEHAQEIDADSVFYYVYGLLHSKDYRNNFATNLQKEYVKIPRVATFADFAKFEQVGRSLAQLHVNYEQVEPYAHCLIEKTPLADFKVTHLHYGKLSSTGKSGSATSNTNKDKTTIVYNDNITIRNIPLEAQEYIVNRLSPLDWLIKLCGINQDKSSGIVNDYNNYAKEVGNDRYIFDLILRVITVSCESVKLIKTLPKLTIHPFDVD